MMWIDDRGVAHTVSLPDPQQLMDSAFADSLAALVRLDSEGVEDAVAQAEEEVFESLEYCAIGVDAGSSPGATPPTQILRGAVHDEPNCMRRSPWWSSVGGWTPSWLWKTSSNH